jgi:hypothetical protein
LSCHALWTLSSSFVSVSMNHLGDLTFAEVQNLLMPSGRSQQEAYTAVQKKFPATLVHPDPAHEARVKLPSYINWVEKGAVNRVKGTMTTPFLFSVLISFGVRPRSLWILLDFWHHRVSRGSLVCEDWQTALHC